MADITTLLEMVPKLSHLYVYEAPITGGAAVLRTGDAEIDLYNAFVTDDAAPVLSSSWGNCEEFQSQAYNDLFATVAEEAAAQGQQIFDAAGDSGAVDCRGSATPTGGSISVEQEAAVPWITGVGGTDLGVESTVAGSGVHDEDTWNDAGAGGGGQSSAWTMPSWQASYLAAAHDTPSGAANDCGAPSGQLCRMVPDISLDADPDAGGLVDQGPLPPQFFGKDIGSPGYDTYCATSNCSLTSQLLPLPVPIGIKPPGGAGGWYPIGGTSLATPLAASAAVLWDQLARHDGLSGVGFLNPSLYRVASDPSDVQGRLPRHHDRLQRRPVRRHRLPGRVQPEPSVRGWTGLRHGERAGLVRRRQAGRIADRRCRRRGADPEQRGDVRIQQRPGDLSSRLDHEWLPRRAVPGSEHRTVADCPQLGQRSRRRSAGR